MHDIDRTMGRTNMETYEFHGEGEEEAGEEEAGEFHAESESVGEEELNHMATELLSVTNEQEMEQFLGDVFKKVTGAVGNFARSPVGRQMGGMLRNVAKQALPAVGQLAGTALGSTVGLGGIGGQLGSQLASGAGQLLGLELEGLSHEDRDFEIAKQIVRLAADAAQNAAQARPGGNASEVAKSAIAEAAQRYAPGLLEPAEGGAGLSARGGTSGRWTRQGNKIVLYGV